MKPPGDAAYWGQMNNQGPLATWTNRTGFYQGVMSPDSTGPQTGKPRETFLPYGYVPAFYGTEYECLRIRPGQFNTTGQYIGYDAN